MFKKEKKEKAKKVEPKKEVKVSWFKNLKMELSKVKWPEGKDVLKYSIATFIFCIIFALFFEGLNLVEAFIKGLFS